MVIRSINPLRDLSNTYFTVENINHSINKSGKSDSKEIKEFYEQMEISDKEKLKPLELIINKLFKHYFSIKYNKEFNHRTYITVTLNRKMKQVKKSLLPNKIKAEQYHTEIIEQEEKQ